MILLLEDDDLDAELMMHRLAEALPDMPVRRVNDRRSYGQALDDRDIRLVISDFSLPDIDGWEALSLAARKRPEVPLIFVSGVIGEDLAVKALKTGATDYVLKQRLDRLGGAVRRALSEAEDRRERRRAEEALRQARDELEQMVQTRTAELLRTNERLLQEMRQRADADSAREQAEEQLRQSQKMEAFGQLTGGVAHDFNNFLTVILGNLETLERQLFGHAGMADTARIELALSHAKQGAQRAAALTQRLLAFARRQPLQPRSVDVNDLIAATAAMLTRMLGEQVDLRNDLQADTWPAHIDPHMLESALLNLAVNARDAMPDGGEIVVQTRNTVLDSGAAGMDAAPGDYVRISISDTGVGIPEDIMEKVFEPFFTTKDIGVGTGLGLSQVYGFVKQSGGHIGIDSAVGKGTTVHIYLPRHMQAQTGPVERTHDHALPVAARGETILVVEDDEAVRAHSAAALMELGYTVHQAGDAMDALRCLRERDDIHMLFTDVGLPRGMNGRDLAEAARAARPGLRVLYTSGYAEGKLTHDGRLPPGEALIPKPFTFSALARRVREILDEAPVMPCEAHGEPAAGALSETGGALEARATAVSGTAGALNTQAAAATGGTRVLVVEDDDLVRELTAEALMEYGYPVAEAGTAAQALTALDSEGEDIAVAIVDLGLPDMRGEELIRRLARCRPGLPIVVASGYGRVDLGSEMPADTRVAFIQKPYELDALYATLKGLGVTP